MRLTDRDRKLLFWINSHGFVTIGQAAQWMRIEYQTAQRRLKILFDHNYLKRQTFEHHGPMCHWCTQNGCDAAGDSLRPPKSINRVTLHHDRMVVDLAALLQTQHGGSFLPERRIRSDIKKKRPGRQNDHLPDGLLYLEGQKPIAIELELSLKESIRLEQIIRNYVTNTKLGAVWYFVKNDAVRRPLMRHIGRLPGFSVMMLEDNAFGEAA